MTEFVTGLSLVCDDCRQVTSGDCGKHGPRFYPPQPPTFTPRFTFSSPSLVVCPVCSGRGFVPVGFYDTFNVASTAVEDTTCRSCSGKGYVRV